MERDNDTESILFDKASSTSYQQILAGKSSRYIRIKEISISTDTAQSVRIQDEDGKGIIGRKFLPANSVWSKSYKNGKTIDLGKGFGIVCGGSTGSVSVDVDYYAKS